MILRILTILIKQMLDQELIVLNSSSEESSAELINQLAEHLAQMASSAQQGAQFSSWLSSQILDSELVEELYASDAQIYKMLSDISL